MKSHFKLFPVFLSIMIVFLSIFQCSITVYASSGGGHSRPSDNENDSKQWFDDDGVLLSDKAVMIYSFLTSEVKCLSDGNFSTFMSNYFDMKDYMTSSHITIMDDVDGNGNGGLVFSEDLTTAFKQALLEYAQEENGFTLMHTINYNSIPPSLFTNTYASSYMYNTFRALVMENGCIALYAYSFGSYAFSACRPFHDNDNPVAFVLKGKQTGNSSEVYIYDACTWQKVSIPMKAFNTMVAGSGYRELHSWDDVEDISRNTTSNDKFFVYKNSSTYWGENFGLGFYLFSTDGRKVKVFNSVDAMKNYTAGYRSVYFGSGFYEDPGEIKVSFDDLEKYLDGKYDNLIDDLKDLIGKQTDNEDSLSEEDLEKLVDKILDKMDETGNDNNPGDNSGILNGISGILEGIASTLSDYFESVLSYLDSILVSIQELIYVETVRPDDDHLDLSNMINDVWKDPQNGSQAVADSLSASFSDIASALMSKFPFCIPNDLYSLMGVFSRTPESRAAPMPLDDDGIQLYSGAGTAPHFEIPFVIESFGIEETVVIDMVVLQPLSTTSRVFFALIFAVALMKLSAMVIQLINNAWGGIS